MNNWMKASIIVFLMLFAFTLTITVIYFVPNPVHDKMPYETFTKALYNGTHLQDYYFECYLDKVIIAPTNASIYVGQDWQDPRHDDLKFKWCGK